MLQMCYMFFNSCSIFTLQYIFLTYKPQITAIQ